MSDKQGDVIAQDPFWSAFSRRHPEVTVVLRPEAPLPQQPPVLPGVDPDNFLRAQEETAEALWARLVGVSSARRDSQWIPGPTRDTLRCSLTFTLDDIGEGDGTGKLREVAQVLSAEGWQLFVPPTGMPRVHADRRGAPGDENVLLGYAPETKRLFLRFRSTGLPVTEAQAHALMGARV